MQAANDLYFAFMACIDNPDAGQRALTKVAAPAKTKDSSLRGFNLFLDPDYHLFLTLARGLTIAHAEHSGYGPAGRAGQGGEEEGVRVGDEGQLVEAAPEDGGAGVAIAPAPEETAELGDHAHGLAQRGRRCGRGGRAVVVAGERLPFGLFEEDAAGDLRGLAPELGQMHDAPGHHQVEGEAGLEALGTGEAAVFDAAAAFQGAMKNLNTPSLEPL